MVALFILLFVIIALVACKYIYFVIKRSRLLFKLKKANAKVTGTHKFWFLGTRGGEKCDFYVETEKVKFRKTKEKEQICDIEATIYCLRESHKGIIIGKGGKMLKKIGTYAREDLEKMLDVKVNLKVWVKVKEDWLNNDKIVKKFKLQ